MAKTIEKRHLFFVKKSCTKLFITKKFLTDCRNSMYFSREFNLKATVQISIGQNLFKLCCQFEKHSFEKNAFKVPDEN